MICFKECQLSAAVHSEYQYSNYCISLTQILNLLKSIMVIKTASGYSHSYSIKHMSYVIVKVPECKLIILFKNSYHNL